MKSTIKQYIEENIFFRRGSYLLLFLVSFVPSLIMIFQVESLSVSDELGTLMNAAFLAGKEWSIWAGQTLAYYKYAQSMFYVPLFYLFKDPVSIYRGALVINAILVAIIPCCANYLLEYAFGIKKQTVSFVLSVMIAFFPAYMLWSKSVMNDSLLMMIPWVLSVLLHKYFISSKKCSSVGVCSDYRLCQLLRI